MRIPTASVRVPQETDGVIKERLLKALLRVGTGSGERDKGW